MALDIKGIKRVFKLKKGKLNAGTGRPGQQNVTDGGYGLLFHELPGTDHGNPARAGI